MKTLIAIMIISTGLFADDMYNMEMHKMARAAEEQTRIMQEQLDLQKKQMMFNQMQKNSIQGQQDQMNGKINLAPAQNWMMTWE